MDGARDLVEAGLEAEMRKMRSKKIGRHSLDRIQASPSIEIKLACCNRAMLTNTVTPVSDLTRQMLGYV